MKGLAVQDQLEFPVAIKHGAVTVTNIRYLHVTHIRTVHLSPVGKPSCLSAMKQAQC